MPELLCQLNLTQALFCPQKSHAFPVCTSRKTFGGLGISLVTPRKLKEATLPESGQARLMAATSPGVTSVFGNAYSLHCSPLLGYPLGSHNYIELVLTTKKGTTMETLGRRSGRRQQKIEIQECSRLRHLFPMAGHASLVAAKEEFARGNGPAPGALF